MNDLKNNYKLILAIFIVLLTIFGVYFIYEKLTNNFSQEEINSIEYSVDNFPTYNDSILYMYANSSSTDLHSFLNNLSNNHKLLLGGVEENISFSTIKNTLISKYGTDLDVEAKDYYMFDEDEEPLYILENGVYIYNENADATDYMTELGEYYLYNYKIKEVKNENNLIAVTYYGLYYQSNFGEENTFYNKDMKLLNKEDKNNYTYFEFESQIDKYFEVNKDKFVQFKYYLEQKDDNYILKDFKILNK